MNRSGRTHVAAGDPGKVPGRTEPLGRGHGPSQQTCSRNGAHPSGRARWRAAGRAVLPSEPGRGTAVRRRPDRRRRIGLQPLRVVQGCRTPGHGVLRPDPPGPYRPPGTHRASSASAAAFAVSSAPWEPWGWPGALAGRTSQAGVRWPRAGLSAAGQGQRRARGARGANPRRRGGRKPACRAAEAGLEWSQIPFCLCASDRVCRALKNKSSMEARCMRGHASNCSRGRRLSAC